MKICIVIDDYLPNSIKVSAKMMHELACEFRLEGHEVTVITPVAISDQANIITLDDITVCRFYGGKIKNTGKVKRAVNETLLSYRAWSSYGEYLKKHRHDLIVYYSPSIFWGSFVKKLKRLWNVPAYLILRDIFPQWAIDQGLIREGTLIEKYFRYFEMQCYEVADTIGVMSQKNLEWFLHKYQLTDKKLEILYNWANNTPVVLKNNYKVKLGLNDKIVYFYGGNMGHAQDMMNIVRLAKNMLNEPNAHFVLVGRGDEFELVKEAVRIQNLKNITLLPAVNQSEYKQMLASFDVGLFTLHREHKTHNFPGKLLGYMVQELPILGSVNIGNDLKNIIESAGAGFVSVNGEDEKLLENAKKFLDSDLRKSMGRKAKKLLESTFSIKKAVEQILETNEKVRKSTRKSRKSRGSELYF